MNHAKLAKILYSSLALSCIDPRLLFAMDTSMEMEVSNKRTFSQSGLAKSNQPSKRRCQRTPAALSELPIQMVVKNAYVHNDCRNFIIEKIYNGSITPERLDINIKKLLRLDSIKIAIETLTFFEIHLICCYNPDNILSTDAGKALIRNLHNIAHPSARNTLAKLYRDGVPGILEQNVDMAIQLYNQAASQGFAFAQYILAKYYLKKAQIESNYEEASEWARRVNKIWIFINHPDFPM
jgi:hypothetical protein